MPDDNANSLGYLFNCMLKYLSLLGRLFSSPSARNSEGEERCSSGNSIYKSTAEREATETAVMAAELIEISSSDSLDYFELSEDEYPSDDSVASTNHAPIPSWADSAAPLSTAIDGPSQMSTSQVSTVNRIASNLGRQGYSGSSLTDHGRTSVKAPSQTSAPIGSSSNGNHVPREMLYFRGLPIAKRSGPPPVGSSSNGNHVPREMLYFRGLPIEKRSGPPPVGPRLTEGDFIRTLNSSQMRETFARSYSAQSIPTLGRGSDNENGSGISNQPTKQRIVSSAAQHTTSADPGFHIRVVEERFGEYDERLIYQAALQDLNQPKAEATLPDGLLSVSLLRHQKIALAWMLQKEKSCCCTGGFLADDQGLGKTISMIALIQFQKLMQSRSKSKDVSHQITNALNLDDDEEENGATALQGSKQDEDSHDLILIPEASASTCNFQAKRPQAGTLVVCPASVLRQWARELEEKVADEARLDVLIYHGSNRTKDPIALAKYDVVLTTYTIVANEVPPITCGDVEEQNKKSREKYSLISDFSGNKKRKKATHASKRKKKAKKGTGNSSIDSDCGTIAKVRWLRVILDEAQIIKNHRTLGARACAGIKAKSRWCLSGTPIQNTIDDLFSYFRFLKYEPYTSYPSFCNKLKDFISRDSVQGYKKLYAVLRAVMLRRTKDTFIDGEPIIRLPAKTINLSQAEFSEEERDFYKKLAANSLSQFKAYAAAGTVNQNYANILLMLLRLRQACDHPLLVKGVSSDVIRKESMETAKNLSRESLIDLMKHLDTSSAICLVCHDPPEDAIVTLCGHVFCYQCVSEYLMGDENTCPVPECKEQLGSEYVFSKATLRSCLGDDHLDESLPSEPEKSLVLQDGYSSSKIKIALEILQSHCRSNNPYSQVHAIAGPGDISTSLKKETFDSVGSVVKATNVTASSDSHTEGPKKAIVFSQWTGMLDLMEVALNQTALKYRRLDGGMKLSARDKAVKEFNNNPEVTVMLMSLKAGNLGLNMVAATHVILLDLWWNPTTEDQAIDRAHRIGQTQPVTVSRLSIKDTVEERILALQEQKRKMVASAFGEDQSGGSGARLTAKDLEFLFMGSRR